MLDELAVLKLVIKRLESAGISYMITGSVATNFYTTPRMTRDIDIVINVNEDDTGKIYSLFSEDFYIDRDMIKDAIHRKQMFNIIHNESVIKVDFVVKKDTEYRKIEFERKRTIDFDGSMIYITSPEDLILSKLYWAKDSLSELQFGDIKNILTTLPDLDTDYLREWVVKLGLKEVFKRVVNK